MLMVLSGARAKFRPRVGGCQSARRDARAGITIVAATTCESASAIFVAVCASASTSGTNDIAVSAIVVVTKVRLGRLARRDNTTARKVPMIEATNVTWANPMGGIESPPTVSGTSIARASAAKTNVATEAERPAIAPVRHKCLAV